MKIIAFYLPQFHRIPENDEWWGEGFTEWVNVRNAEPIFEGHDQPRIPLNDNYYDLLDSKTMRWQIDLAKQNGIYGFCFYHYWFNGHMLLQKPMERFYSDPELNIPYCICWANEDWTNAWVAEGNIKTLIKQDYGKKEDWLEHFNYLLPFFRDKNYIFVDGKPMFVLYRPEICSHLNEMLDYWNDLAIKTGLAGICFIYQQVTFYLDKLKDDSRFSYYIEYQPGYARYDIQLHQKNAWRNLITKMKSNIRILVSKIDRVIHTNLSSRVSKRALTFEDYDELCTAIINRKPTDEKAIPGMFVGWDNTPRRGKHGRVCLNSTPEKFKYYMTKQIQNTISNYKKDMIFLFAWNEWAEGGYLEPDKKNGLGYLDAIKDALELIKK